MNETVLSLMPFAMAMTSALYLWRAVSATWRGDEQTMRFSVIMLVLFMLASFHADTARCLNEIAKAVKVPSVETGK